MDFSARCLVLTLSFTLAGCATDRAIEEISQEFVMPEEVESVVFQAKKAELQGQYIEAIEQYKAALEKNQDDLAAQVGLAGVYLRQGVLVEAESLLKRVSNSTTCTQLEQLSEKPVTPVIQDKADTPSLTETINQREEHKKNAEYCGVAWNGLGVIADIHSDFELAEKRYVRAIEYRPDDASFYNNYGYSLMMARHYEEAENILRKGYSLAPNSKRLRNNLAFSLAWMGRYSQALETFSVTLDDPEAYNNIGYIALLSHDYNRAIDLFEKAIELSPAFYVKASHNLRKARRLKEAEDIRKDLQQPDSVDPTTLPVTSAAGDVQSKVVSLSEAVNDEETQVSVEIFDAQIPVTESEPVESTP
jgi:Flp pilus assembly protein TadD